MGMAKSDFSQMRQSRSDLIMNTERFARIDLDLKKNATNESHGIELWSWCKKFVQEDMCKMQSRAASFF